MTEARPKSLFAGPPAPPTYWSYPETRDAANRVGKAWDKLISQGRAEEREAARWEAAAESLNPALTPRQQADIIAGAQLRRRAAAAAQKAADAYADSAEVQEAADVLRAHGVPLPAWWPSVSGRA